MRKVAYDSCTFRARRCGWRGTGIDAMVAFPQSHWGWFRRASDCTPPSPSAAYSSPGTHPQRARGRRHRTPTVRGWSVDKLGRDVQINAVIALAMAAERAEHQPAPVKLL